MEENDFKIGDNSSSGNLPLFWPKHMRVMKSLYKKKLEENIIAPFNFVSINEIVDEFRDLKNK